jgi:hypothetical protein
MTITLTYLTTTLTLPASLQWVDEFAWNAVEESFAYSVTGVLLVDRGVKLAGRPITLQGGRSGNRVWAAMPRSAILTLRGWADTAAAQMTLAYRGTPYTVAWDRTQGSAIEATPVLDIANPAAGDIYIPTLRLVTV